MKKSTVCVCLCSLIMYTDAYTRAACTLSISLPNMCEWKKHVHSCVRASRRISGICSHWAHLRLVTKNQPSADKKRSPRIAMLYINLVIIVLVFTMCERHGENIRNAFFKTLQINTAVTQRQMKMHQSQHASQHLKLGIFQCGPDALQRVTSYITL